MNSLAKQKNKPKSYKPLRRNLLFERGMALFAVANFGLVLFDLSYIPWRNFYLFNIGGFSIELLGFRVGVPRITDIYDPIKGIEPHRDTVAYINTVNRLKAEVADQGLRSPQVATTLDELKTMSNEIIDSNPFAAANKTGTLERIKNRMRSHMGDKSSKESFALFWSQTHLSQAGFIEEIKFYDEQIQRLLQTNYFRQIDETGGFVDRFFLLDMWFINIIAVEIALRIVYLHRSRNLSWTEAALWRWYDFLFFLPFLQPIRIIPIIVRLSQVKLINIETLKQQLQNSFIATFSEQLTQAVIVRIFDQMEDSVQNLDLKKLLSEGKTYIDINNTNEVAAIASIVLQATIEDVLPQMRPSIEALLKHATENALQQVSLYKGITQIPGLGVMQQQVTEQIVLQISQTLFSSIKNLPPLDTKTIKLSEDLMQNLSDILAKEMRQNKSMDKVKLLLIDLLQEIKINYVKKLSQQEWEEILAQTNTIQQSVK